MMLNRSKVRVDRVAFSAAWLIVGLASLLAVVTVAPATADENHTYKRWGIIVAGELQQTGLADLVLAELSKEKGIELVERQQLDAALKELKLSAMLGSDAAGRLKLGRMLNADALVFMSLSKPEPSETPKAREAGQEKQAEEPWLELIVSDCVYGARLRVDHLKYDPGEVEKLAKRCASSVLQTQKRFTAGIKQIIGVTQFASKNLTHKYDHLQASYTYLLENALLSFPGVAVLETKEARAIGREFGLGGGGPKKRVIPLFVGGEFEMIGGTSDAEPTVRMTLNFTDGRQSDQTLERSGLSFPQVATFLSRELPLYLVQRVQKTARVGLSGEQQVKLLAARADVFSQLGVWDVAIGLREAAMLLKPHDTPQQLAVIGDYIQLIEAESRAYRVVPHGKDRKKLHKEITEHNLKVWEKLSATQIPHWQVMLKHIEDIIRRKEVNPAEASCLVSSGMGRIGALRPYRYQASLEVKEIAHEFFWRVYPLFPKLEYGTGTVRTSVLRRTLRMPTAPRTLTAEQQHNSWTGTGVSLIDVYGGSWRFYESPKDPRMLDDLHRFLTEVISQDMPPTYRMGLLFVGEYGFLNRVVKDDRFTVHQIRQFCERLKQTDQPMTAFYGRCGLVSLQLVYGTGKESIAEGIQEVNALLKFLKDRGYDKRPGLKGNTSTVRPVYNALHNVRRKFTEKSRRASSGNITKVLNRKRAKFVPSRINPIDTNPRVVFSPIDGVEPNWSDLLKCTESLDVMWSWETVYAMAKRGQVKRIFSADKELDAIETVVWDGANVWIGTINSGVWIVSPQGRILGHVGEDEGLPPYNKARDLSSAQSDFQTSHRELSLLIHPVEPGKCIAIGTTGKHRRVWFATLSRTQDASKPASYGAKVFFTATKLNIGQVDVADANPELAFPMAWIVEYSSPTEPRKRLLLVGRQQPSGRPGGRCPLAIDLNTLDVSVFPTRLPSSTVLDDSGREFYSSHGRIFFGGQVARKPGTLRRKHGIRVFSPPKNEGTGEWTSKFLIESRGRRLIPHGGMLYHLSRYWSCVNVQNLQCEDLSKGVKCQRYHHYSNYGVSAHYGLVAWDSPGSIYLSCGWIRKTLLARIEIDPSGPRDPAALYPRVPKQFLQKHDQAMLALSKLGALIGEGEQGQRMAGPQVILTRQWKGADKGLAYLKDLYNLNSLSVAGTPITDEGLRYIGQIKQLRKLYLVETKITDDGLRHLAGLGNLSILRLEGTLADNKFSDDGLKHVGDLPRLDYLILWGPRFTNEAISHLKTMPRLRRLSALDTKITKAALSNFEESKHIDASDSL